MSLAILVGVLGTSLVGSVHCVAMCGPLVGLHGGARTLRLAFVHAAGRLTTYAALGALAGLIGSAMNLAGRLANVQRAAAIVAAATIVGMGVYQIVHVTRARARARARRRSPFTAALVQLRTKPPGIKAWLLGMLTGLIPCGWLWAFVITAAGTGSLPAGALVMVAFWLGTLPAMVGVLSLAGPVLARLRARMPAVTAIALIAMGVGTLALRWRDAGAQQVYAPHCHCHDSRSS